MDFEEFEERYFGGDYGAFCSEYDPMAGIDIPEVDE